MSERRFRYLMDKVTNFAILFKGTDGIIEEDRVRGRKRTRIDARIPAMYYDDPPSAD